MTLTTSELAKVYYDLANQNKWEEIIDRYYDEDIECIEPPNSKSAPYTKGKVNVKAKAMHFQEIIEAFHSGYVTEPVVAGDLFAVGIGMEFTMKGAGRARFDEVGIFRVKNGKIIREEFVMTWSDGAGHTY